MPSEEIRKIIEFAIDKEQEAVDFYTDLMGRVKSEAVAKELNNMVRMEQAHRTMLENLDLDSFVESKSAPIKDLKIADYTVDAVPNSEMSWPDVLNIAMHRELAAANLYKDLAATVEDDKVKVLFENLASEEKKHKLYLETLWDQDVMKEN